MSRNFAMSRTATSFGTFAAFRHYSRRLIGFHNVMMCPFMCVDLSGMYVVVYIHSGASRLRSPTLRRTHARRSAAPSASRPPNVLGLTGHVCPQASQLTR
eukprot:5668883-Pleurochrysis_carterae.AAC.4